jgi:hypothetical protein
MGMMRRYRLHGLIAVAALVALLVAWRGSVPLLPRRTEAQERERALVLLGRDAHAGLAALLRSAAPGVEVLRACVSEWERALGRTSRIAPQHREAAREIVARDLENTSAVTAGSELGPPIPKRADLAARKERRSVNENIERLLATLARARTEAGKVIIGHNDAIDLALIAIFSGSHALVEGVPGVAKTLLVRTLAQVLGCPFGRIQFTPDLMPADITGTNVFNLRDNEFRLVKGPVFTSFLLADEINRAPAKTQSALLQAMQERCVSIDRETHVLPPDFTVFATQNPSSTKAPTHFPRRRSTASSSRSPWSPPGARTNSCSRGVRSAPMRRGRPGAW